MADAVFEVGVKIIGDDSELKTATEGAAQSVTDMADSMDAATKQTTTTLEDLSSTATTSFDAFAAAASDAATSVADSSTNAASAVTDAFADTGEIPSAVDAGAVSLTTKATKYKAVGTQLGAAIADGAASGVSAPQAVSNLTTSVTSLLAFTAKTLQGAGALVGVGVAVSIVTGLVKAWGADEAKFQAAVKKTFDGIEVTADDTLRSLRQKIQDTFSFTSTVDALGGDKLFAVADQFGEKMSTVVQLINGEMTPAAGRLKSKMEDVNAEAAVLVAGGKVQGQTDNVRQQAAADLLKWVTDNRDVKRETLRLDRQSLDYAKKTVGTTREEQLARKAANQEEAKHLAEVDKARTKAAQDLRHELRTNSELTDKEAERLRIKLRMITANQNAAAAAEREAAAAERIYRAISDALALGPVFDPFPTKHGSNGRGAGGKGSP